MGRGAVATAIGVLALAAYFVALHLLIADRSKPRLALALALAPWVLAALSIFTRKRRYWLLPIVAAIAGLVFWRFGDVLAARVDHVLYLENLAFMLFLSMMFAITLRPGREALVTKLARSVRGGDMPDAVVRYTRAVTAAWALYFVAIATISTVLFLTQPRAIWSLFVNVLVWPLTAGMFVVEYAIRLRVLRDLDHVSLIATVRAFMQRSSRTAERR